jgi:hypothetical protein
MNKTDEAPGYNEKVSWTVILKELQVSSILIVELDKKDKKEKIERASRIKFS